MKAVLASVMAGRDRLYLQRFAPDADRGPELVPFGEVKDWDVPGLTCVGNRADEIARELVSECRPVAYYPASAIARIAADRWQSNSGPPVPLYIRAADAAPSRDVPPKILDA